MKVKQITETSVGSTSSGAIASVSSPIGAAQKRGSMFKGKKTKKKFYEGKMKDLAYDILHLDAGNFVKKYGHPKDYFTTQLGNPPIPARDKPGTPPQPVHEDEINEQDLIILPGMRRSKDTSFIPHAKDRRDHEVEMARSDVYAAAKDAMRIFKLLKDRSEDQGIMGWQQSYITLASDYLNSVADSLEYQGVKGEGVIAGGMSNFEESDSNLNQQTFNAVYQELIKAKPDFMMTAPTKDVKRAILKAMSFGSKISVNDLAAYAYGMLKTNDIDEGRYYDPMGDERREQQAMDDERRDFKRREQNTGLEGEEERARRYEQGPWYILKNGKLVKDKNKNPFTFNTLSAAQKAVKTMREKEWNKDKKFVYTRTPKDSDVSEGKYRGVPTKVQNMLDEIMLLRTQAEMAADRQQWKKVEVLNDKIEKTEEIILQDPKGQAALDNFYKSLGNKVADDNVIENKCPSCGGELVSEEMINEKKDACYYKVKSRYKVWPSAYASGALVKCRKKGASNWGKNKK